MRSGAPTAERAQELVRDRWLAAGDYQALVAAILGNWTSGNCIPFMAPVSKALLVADETDLHQHLWARSIKRQADTFFREYSPLRGQKLTSEAILSVDSSGFDEFNWDCYADKLMASSFLLTRLLSDLGKWRDELVAHHLSPDRVDQIVACLRALQKPKIEVARLTPNNSFKPMPLRGTA